MLSKLVVIVILAEVLSSRNEAEAACPTWVKLNKAPVCFGAKGNQFGSFTYDRNIFVRSFMLVHRSGKVTCYNKNARRYSYWGCDPNQATLIVILTDQNNKILAPEASTVSKGGWYTLKGYTSSSSVLVFCAPKKPHCVLAGTQLRLWYGEDLRRDAIEDDNGGKTCADVFAMLA